MVGLAATRLLLLTSHALADESIHLVDLEAEQTGGVLDSVDAERYEGYGHLLGSGLLELDADADSMHSEAYGQLLGLNTSEISAESELAEGPIQSWPSDLDKLGYKHIRKLGCGANSCAFLAKRLRDDHVMVMKVNVHNLEIECGWMRDIRVAACRNHDREAKGLLETYVPTCDDMGRTAGGLFYLAQPMAGDEVLSQKLNNGRHSWNSQEEKEVAVQLIAGVYAMHAVGFWHNDLNGENIVVDGTKISLIDLGLASTTHCRSQRCKGSYSRDGNALFRWLAELAKCPADARWDHRAWWRKADLNAQKAAQDRALDCIKNRWNPDEKFMQALGRVFDANARESVPEQHVAELYMTKFVGENWPRQNTPTYRIPETDGCDTWSATEIHDKSRALGCIRPRDYVAGGLP